MQQLVSQLGINWKILIAQIVNFAILFYLLKRFLYKPVMNMLDGRQAQLEKDRKNSLEIAERLRKAEEENRETLGKARAEANALIQDTKKKTEARRAEMLDAAKSETAALLARGKKSLEAEKARMIDDARKEIAALAVEAAKKLLRSEAGESFDERAAKEVGALK